MLIVVLVHVDDCSIVGNTRKLVDRFKVEMAKFVDITDLGELHWILGIEVCRIREERKLLLSQKSYIDSILRRYNFDDLKPISTPMDQTTPSNPSIIISLSVEAELRTAVRNSEVRLCIKYKVKSGNSPCWNLNSEELSWRRKTWNRREYKTTEMQLSLSVDGFYALRTFLIGIWALRLLDSYGLIALLSYLEL